MTKIVSRVRISFFKPTGFEDTHYVATDDRGLAAQTVLARYGKELRSLNYIEVSSCSLPPGKSALPPSEIAEKLERKAPKRED